MAVRPCALVAIASQACMRACVRIASGWRFDARMLRRVVERPSQRRILFSLCSAEERQTQWDTATTKEATETTHRCAPTPVATPHRGGGRFDGPMDAIPHACLRAKRGDCVCPCDIVEEYVRKATKQPSREIRETSE